LALVGGVYAARHFAIDADVNKLISVDLPWRQREAAFNKFFPSQEETMLAVVDAPTSELATQAANALIQKLSAQKDHFHSIVEGGGGPFFQKNGLLFLPAQEVVGVTKKLGEGKPVIQALAQDSNLRGLTTALNYGLNRVRFPAPVRVGSQVRAAVSVASAHQKTSGVESVFTLTFEIDGEDRPACVADVIVLYP